MAKVADDQSVKEIFGLHDGPNLVHQRPVIGDVFARGERGGLQQRANQGQSVGCSIALPGLIGRDIVQFGGGRGWRDRKSTRLNSSHDQISYAVFCLKKKKKNNTQPIEHKKTKNHKKKTIQLKTT